MSLFPFARKTLFFAAVLFGFAMILDSMCNNATAAGALRVGAAVVKISPANGTLMAGYYSERGSQGVLDDLYAKAAVFDDGQTQTAIVVCDLIGLSRALVAEARQRIQEKTGIPGDNVMIAATHTHTGPIILGNTSLDDVAAKNNALNQEYAKQLPNWIAQAVADAKGRLTEARLTYGCEYESNISFIRRFWMKDGTVGWNPGKMNPNIIRPIGVIDPQMNVVYAETPDQKPLLTFANFAIHLDTTGGQQVSGDAPATLANRLADYKGPEMVTIFANGTCGNINHIDVTSAEKQGGPQEAKRIGTVLAAAVLKSYRHLKPIDDATLRVRREVVELPPAKYTEEELQKAREIAEKHGKDTPFLEQVKAYRILDIAARDGKPFDVDVQVFSLGRDIAWVALPGEVFVELGQSIKAASPFKQTNVIELANGGPSYVPNRSAYAEGQYEPISTRYAEGAGEMLVTTAIRLLANLDREAAEKTSGK
jgi:hypothetical protein